MKGDVVDTVMAKASGGSAILASTGTLLIMVVMVAEVFMRMAGRGSIAGAFELVETTVVFIVFLGMGWAERRDQHVRMSLVIERLPTRIAHVMRSSGTLAAIAVVGAMTWSTGQRAAESVAAGEFRRGLVEWPVWPARIAVTVGLGMLFVELVLTLLKGRERSSSKPVTES